MTNDEFKAFREMFFASQASAATYLDMSRDEVKSLETGVTRKGSPYPVKHHIALACMALARGLVVVPPQFSSGIKTPAPGRSMAEQTKLIRARADGSVTANQIADELKVKRSAVYAAIAAARKNGSDARLMLDHAANNPPGSAGKPD